MSVDQLTGADPKHVRALCLHAADCSSSAVSWTLKETTNCRQMFLRKYGLKRKMRRVSVNYADFLEFFQLLVGLFTLTVSCLFPSTVQSLSTKSRLFSP